MNEKRPEGRFPRQPGRSVISQYKRRCECSCNPHQAGEELIGTTERIFDGDEDAYLSLLGVINHYLDVTRRGPE
jgi:hypothetical protein